MGSSSAMPTWSKIKKNTESYSREIYHITGDNKTARNVLSCDIEKTSSGEFIKIWDINFKVTKFEEQCFNSSLSFKNIYYVDTKGLVRRSLQYHSRTLGFVSLERLDR